MGKHPPGDTQISDWSDKEEFGPGKLDWFGGTISKVITESGKMNETLEIERGGKFTGG